MAVRFFFFLKIPSSGEGSGLCSCDKNHGPATGLESVVSELRRGLEGLQPQCPAWMNSLFGAIRGLAACRPAKIDEGRVCRVEGCYAERGQRGRAIGGARCRTGGGKRGREGVKW